MKNSSNNSDNCNIICDYESDQFIKLAQEYDSKNITTSSLINKKRKRTTFTNSSNIKNLSMKETLIKGLNQPIEKSNKGFQLLLKMGFKEGCAIGKSNKGIVEPINITDVLNKQDKKKLTTDDKKDIEQNLMQNKNLNINMQHNLNLNKKITQVCELKEKNVKFIKIIFNLRDDEKGGEGDPFIIFLNKFCEKLLINFPQIDSLTISEFLDEFDIKSLLKENLSLVKNYANNLCLLDKIHSLLINSSNFLKSYTEVNYLFCLNCNSKFELISEIKEHSSYCQDESD